MHTANNSNAIDNQRRMLLTHFQEMIGIFSNRVKDISNDQQRIGMEFRRIQTSYQAADQNFSSIKTSHEDLVSRTIGMTLTQDLLTQQIWSLKQDAHNALSTSHDGKYIWKITGVRDKIGIY
jgi:hypothetical protein